MKCKLSVISYLPIIAFNGKHLIDIQQIIIKIECQLILFYKSSTETSNTKNVKNNNKNER